MDPKFLIFRKSSFNWQKSLTGFDEFDFGRGDEPALIAIYGTRPGVVIVRIDGDGPSGEAFVQRAARRIKIDDVEFHELGEDSFGIMGTLPGETGEAQAFAMVLGIGAGTSVLRVDDSFAFLSGGLGSGTYRQIKYFIQHKPEVTCLVFENVPGSVNDEINVKTGRLIREAGYTTIVLEDGMIASGGVDLFVAGVERVIEAGARVGVHSWGDPTGDVVANDLPVEHEAHRSQISYFSEMLPNGKEFYFYTLQAAPFDGIHLMTRDEIRRWGLESEIPDIEQDDDPADKEKEQ